MGNVACVCGAYNFFYHPIIQTLEIYIHDYFTLFMYVCMHADVSTLQQSTSIDNEQGNELVGLTNTRSLPLNKLQQ